MPEQSLTFPPITTFSFKSRGLLDLLSHPRTFWRRASKIGSPKSGVRVSDLISHSLLRFAQLLIHLSQCQLHQSAQPSPNFLTEGVWDIWRVHLRPSPKASRNWNSVSLLDAWDCWNDLNLPLEKQPDGSSALLGCFIICICVKTISFLSLSPFHTGGLTLTGAGDRLFVWNTNFTKFPVGRRLYFLQVSFAIGHQQALVKSWISPIDKKLVASSSQQADSLQGVPWLLRKETLSTGFRNVDRFLVSKKLTWRWKNPSSQKMTQSLVEHFLASVSIHVFRSKNQSSQLTPTRSLSDCGWATSWNFFKDHFRLVSLSSIQPCRELLVWKSHKEIFQNTPPGIYQSVAGRSSSQGLNLNRSQFGGCSTKYNTLAGT